MDDLPGELTGALGRRAPRCVVLDAMGVIFAAQDDVAELLVPFVRAQGGARHADIVESAYLDASLGEIDADTFWRRVGLAPDVEPAYLASHRLGTGTLEFLAKARDAELLVETGYPPSELLLVDDRANNVRSAAALGIPSLEFKDAQDFERLSAALFAHP